MSSRAASAGAGPVVFSVLSRALRVQSLACPHLPASPMRPSWMQRSATAPPAGFSHSWGHRLAASPGQDFLLLGVARMCGTLRHLIIGGFVLSQGAPRLTSTPPASPNHPFSLFFHRFFIDIEKKRNGWGGPRAPGPGPTHFFSQNHCKTYRKNNENG